METEVKGKFLLALVLVLIQLSIMPASSQTKYGKKRSWG